MTTTGSTLLNTLNLLLTPFHAIFSLLPTPLRHRLTFTRDLTISLTTLLIGRLLPRLPSPPTPSTHSLNDRTAIITGANSGIGLQIALDLASSGATIILACRNLSNASAALSTIHARVPSSIGRVEVMYLDTSSAPSVRAFADTWAQREGGKGRRIDVLVHNAGIASPVAGRDFTDEGVEVMYATNFLGGFLLTCLLERWLGGDARVVLTSSTGQYGGLFGKFGERSVEGVVECGFHCPPVKRRWWLVGGGNGYGEGKAAGGVEGRYGNTKSMQCAFARALQKKWDLEVVEGRKRDDGLMDRKKQGMEERVRGRIAHSFTPNFTSTPIFGKIEFTDGWWSSLTFRILRATTVLAVDVDQGAATGSWLASASDEKVVGFGNGGGYWDRMTRRLCGADRFSDEILERLWRRWEMDAGVEWM